MALVLLRTMEIMCCVQQQMPGSLDKTIQLLGRTRVEGVTEYRPLKAMAIERCSSQAVFPCTTEGEIQYEESKKSCYVLDEGCGYQCIDEMLGALV